MPDIYMYKTICNTQTSSDTLLSSAYDAHLLPIAENNTMVISGCHGDTGLKNYMLMLKLLYFPVRMKTIFPYPKRGI